MQLIDCGDVLDISVVKALQTKLIDANLTGEPLQLNAQALQRIDTAGMQLLIALFRDAAEEQRKVAWQSTSPALLAAAQYIGATEILALSDKSA